MTCTTSASGWGSRSSRARRETPRLRWARPRAGGRGAAEVLRPGCDALPHPRIRSARRRARVGRRAPSPRSARARGSRDEARAARDDARDETRVAVTTPPYGIRMILPQAAPDSMSSWACAASASGQLGAELDREVARRPAARGRGERLARQASSCSVRGIALIRPEARMPKDGIPVRARSSRCGPVREQRERYLDGLMVPAQARSTVTPPGAASRRRSSEPVTVGDRGRAEIAQLVVEFGAGRRRTVAPRRRRTVRRPDRPSPSRRAPAAYLPRQRPRERRA